MSVNQIITETNYDFIEIFDGASETDLSLGKFSGNLTLPNMTSSSNKLIIKFTTDSSQVRQGFLATYKLNQKGIIKLII